MRRTRLNFTGRRKSFSTSMALEFNQFWDAIGMSNYNNSNSSAWEKAQVHHNYFPWLRAPKAMCQQMDSPIFEAKCTTKYASYANQTFKFRVEKFPWISNRNCSHFLMLFLIANEGKLVPFAGMPIGDIIDALKNQQHNNTQVVLTLDNNYPIKLSTIENPAKEKGPVKSRNQVTNSTGTAAKVATFAMCATPLGSLFPFTAHLAINELPNKKDREDARLILGLSSAAQAALRSPASAAQPMPTALSAMLSTAAINKGMENAFESCRDQGQTKSEDPKLDCFEMSFSTSSPNFQFTGVTVFSKKSPSDFFELQNPVFQKGPGL